MGLISSVVALKLLVASIFAPRPTSIYSENSDKKRARPGLPKEGGRRRQEEARGETEGPGGVHRDMEETGGARKQEKEARGRRRRQEKAGEQTRKETRTPMSFRE